MAESRPQNARRRLVPVAFLIGCALLAASVAGASWGIHTPSGETLPSEAVARPVSQVVCHGHVDVDSGVIPLYPVQPGRVQKVFVRDNDDVEAGAPLFQMDDTLARAQLVEAKADLAASQARLELAGQLPGQHKAQVEGQQAAVEAKIQELNAAIAKHNQAKRLSESRLGSVDDTKMAAAAVKAMESAVDVEKAKLRGLDAMVPRAGIKQAEREVEAKKAQLEKAEYGLRECTVRAPRKGKVLRLEVSEGESLSATPRHPALQFCPDSPRIIRAEVEQEFAGGVVLNQIAKIHDDASGDVRWTGKVARISDWYTHRRSIMLEPLQVNDVRTLECIVTVDPSGPPLRIGQRVRVTLQNATQD